MLQDFAVLSQAADLALRNAQIGDIRFLSARREVVGKLRSRQPVPDGLRVGSELPGQFPVVLPLRPRSIFRLRSSTILETRLVAMIVILLCFFMGPISRRTREMGD